MPRLSANLSLLFTEVPFRERFAAAAAAGFRRVEYHFPYAEGSALQVAGWARAAGVKVVLQNIPAGDRARAEIGLACLPSRTAEFHAAVDLAIGYAQAADCRLLNCLAGVAPAGAAREELIRTLVSNLRAAADRAAGAGISLLLEPLNARGNPGYLLNRSAEAIDVIRAVARPNVRLLYDLFHMQISEGDLSTNLRHLLPDVAHIQIAAAPSRNEPDAGEMNHAWLLGEIDNMGYQGVVGCEYQPLTDTLSGLGWARAWLDPPAAPHETPP